VVKMPMVVYCMAKKKVIIKKIQNVEHDATSHFKIACATPSRKFHMVIKGKINLSRMLECCKIISTSFRVLTSHRR
jgi:hypothetical protein